MLNTQGVELSSEHVQIKLLLNYSVREAFVRLTVFQNRNTKDNTLDSPFH